MTKCLSHVWWSGIWQGSLVETNIVLILNTLIISFAELLLLSLVALDNIVQDGMLTHKQF